MAEETKELNCSFCGKAKSEVDRLIAGPGVYICNECIDLLGTEYKIPYFKNDFSG